MGTFQIGNPRLHVKRHDSFLEAEHARIHEEHEAKKRFAAGGRSLEGGGAWRGAELRGIGVWLVRGATDCGVRRSFGGGLAWKGRGILLVLSSCILEGWVVFHRSLNLPESPKRMIVSRSILQKYRKNKK